MNVVVWLSASVTVLLRFRLSYVVVIVRARGGVIVLSAAAVISAALAMNPAYVRAKEELGPMAKLRRTEAEIRAAVSRRVPDWSPEADMRRRQIERLRRVRAARDQRAARRALDTLRRMAERGGNTMPAIVDAVKARVTQGEICDVFRAVYGEYREPAIL